MTILDSIANEEWFRDTSIILLLHNINQFEQKLDKVPLKNYFSDFNGGNDVNRATEYLIRRFDEANGARRNLSPHLTELTDMTNIQWLILAVRRAIYWQEATYAIGMG